MAIQATQTPLIQSTTAGNIPPNPRGDMGADTFMKLLVAELKQQDPNEPMQAREMVTQLAQLSSVQKLNTIEQRLGELNDGAIANASMQSAGLIGRKVSAKTNRISLDGLSQPQGSYQLRGDADKINIKILNSQGQLVRSVDVANQRSGPHNFQWDGKTATGMRAEPGVYSFEISAVNKQGIPVPASTEVSGLVTEVTYKNGAPEVVIGGANVSLTDVTSIAQ